MARANGEPRIALVVGHQHRVLRAVDHQLALLDQVLDAVAADLGDIATATDAGECAGLDQDVLGVVVDGREEVAGQLERRAAVDARDQQALSVLRAIARCWPSGDISIRMRHAL